MIITCNECDTRFNLDESLLKQTGSKVRCSKCKNIFTAYPVEEAATGSQEEIDFSDIDNFLEMDVDLKAEKKPEEPNSEIDETPAETEAEIDFELNMDIEPELHPENEIDGIPIETKTGLELELDDKISSETSEEDPEGLDKDRENEESKHKNEASDLELDLEIDETPAETEAEVDFELNMDIEQDKTIEKYTAEKIAEEKETSKTFNMGTLSDEPEDEKAVESVDKVEKSASIEESKPQKTVEKKRIGKPVLLLLVATLLISGTYGTYVLINSLGINIPFVSNLLKPKVEEAGNLKIYISDINNKFVENLKSGKLLVITGKAKNGYSDARSYINIISKLYTKDKILSKTKTVYCGTVLSELDLINMELDSINNRLSNRFGDNKSNVKVKAGASIPFMVVFADFPENLDEFTIEVARSLPF